MLRALGYVERKTPRVRSEIGSCTYIAISLLLETACLSVLFLICNYQYPTLYVAGVIFSSTRKQIFVHNHPSNGTNQLRNSLL